MRTKLFLTGLAFIAFTALATAQDPVAGQGQGKGRGPCNGTGKGSAYVDANKDGICDNLGTSNAGASGKRGAGNGRCNGKGQGQGKGRNFVDANKNGICDTFEARTKN
jgi:hypothetical protein